jgi:hypothetical protein
MVVIACVMPTSASYCAFIVLMTVSMRLCTAPTLPQWV